MASLSIENANVQTTPSPSINKPQSVKSDFFEKKLANTNVKIGLGELTSQEADAYFLHQFRNSVYPGTLQNSLTKAGYQDAINEFEDHVNQYGPLKFTTNFVSKGGPKAKHIIHSVVCGVSADEQFSVIRKAMFKVLKTAEKYGLKKICIPVCGTAPTGSLSFKQSAKAILAGLQDFLNQGGHIDEFKIMVRQKVKCFEAYKEVLANDEFKNITAADEANTEQRIPFNEEAWKNKYIKSIHERQKLIRANNHQQEAA